MNSAPSPKKTIRVGVELGSTTCRAAYLYPDEERALVTVPLTPNQLQPVFPIAEAIPTTRMFASRFFPGLVQRLVDNFAIQMGGRPQTAPALVELLLGQVVEAARTYSGCAIEGLLVAHPVWLDATGRDLIRDAAANVGTGNWDTVSDLECMCAYYRRRGLDTDSRASVLAVSAGYTGVGIALVRLTPRGLRVLGACGDQGTLAGNTMDYAILQSTIEQLAQHGILYANVDRVTAWSELQYGAEAAKHALDEADHADFLVPLDLTPRQAEPVRARVSGPAFRAYVKEHVDRAVGMVEGLLSEAGIEPREIEHLLVEGGSMHLPGVIQALGALCPAAQLSHLPPDAVAGGAAVLMGELGGAAPDQPGEVVAATPQLYQPATVAIAGLVELVLGGPEQGATEAEGEGRKEADEGRSAPPDAVVHEAVDTGALTLNQIRERAELGDVAGAVRDLERLARAVNDELSARRGESQPMHL